MGKRKRCTGCGTTRTIKEIKARYPKALSCCPERKMVAPDKLPIVGHKHVEPRGLDDRDLILGMYNDSFGFSE